MAIEKIYWDSDAFLGWIQNEEHKVDKCGGVLDKAERGEILIVTSALSLAEVLWMRGGPKVPKEKARIVQNFFRRSYIRVHNVTRKISEEAQILVWDHSIKPKDAIHIATAMHLNIHVVETFDQNLIGKSGHLCGTFINIREPHAAVQTSLRFDAQGALH